jgi:hypothetical protein
MTYEPLTNPPREHIIHNVLWVVDLSDGRRVYQNDHASVVSSWLLLKHYLYDRRKSGLSIRQMFLQFRDNFFHVDSDVEAYYFSKKLLGQFGTGASQDYYVVGSTKDGKNLLTKHLIVPDLVLDEPSTEVRDLETKQFNRGLIVHPDYLENFPYNEYFDE